MTHVPRYHETFCLIDSTGLITGDTGLPVGAWQPGELFQHGGKTYEVVQLGRMNDDGIHADFVKCIMGNPPIPTTPVAAHLVAMTRA